MVEKKKHGIVAFAFGVQETILSNRRIAEIATLKAKQLQAPVFTQAGISLKEDIEVERVKEESGNPPPTLRLARAAVQWAISRGIDHLWAIAAWPHLWRCLRDLNYAVRESRASIQIHICEEVYKYSTDSWYCLDSTQERVRSKKAWQKRDRILKLMPMFLYKLVAS